MPHLHVVTRSIEVKRGTGARELKASQSDAGVSVYTGFARVSVEAAIPKESTDVPVNCHIELRDLLSLYIASDLNVTIQTNNKVSPDQTISIVGGVPYLWAQDGYAACIVTKDISELFVTNANDAKGATLVIEALHK